MDFTKRRALFSLAGLSGILLLLPRKAAASYQVPGSVLFTRIFTGLNFNTTNDQALVVNSADWIVRRITAFGSSTSLTLAAGGIYTAASKGGNALVAAAQIYTALTASSKLVDLTVASIGLTDRVSVSTIYLSLTTAQGGAATGSLLIEGHRLD